MMILSAAGWPRVAQAANLASISISMDVQSSISLIFQDNPNVGQSGFCPLSNSGTDNVGLDFGIGSWPGNDTSSCVATAHHGNRYEVYSAFDVVVMAVNSTSTSYNLQVALGSPAPAGFAFYLNGLGGAALNTTLQPIPGQSAQQYATPVTETLYIQVQQSTPAQTISQAIKFVATAN
jgi:hypothetical protein